MSEQQRVEAAWDETTFAAIEDALRNLWEVVVVARLYRRPRRHRTTLEAMIVWQLCQVRHLYDAPFILVGSMWRELVDWAQASMLDGKRNLADPVDMTSPHCVGSVDEAAERIREHKTAREARPGPGDPITARMLSW